MSKTKQKRIVIVDGYSTGRELLRELLERNTECLHLRSTEALPGPVATCFDPRPYDADLGYLGDPAAAIRALREIAPDEVVPGSEWGVTLAEQIAQGLGLPTNRIETIDARRDKFAMIEAVHRCGLHVARQSLASGVEEAHDWARRHGSWPVVVKPLDSAGSDGVTICNSHADIETAFAKAFRRENFMGGFNDRLLMQSFLSGPQFIVNTVSRDGRHAVTDAWHMTLATRSDFAIVPEEIHLLEPTMPLAEMLIDYTLNVLEALGIENGAAHTELKWTPQGPALIETGARLMGAAMDRPSYDVAGATTQASAYAASLVGGQRERDELFAKRHYALHNHLTKVFFSFQEKGVVQSIDGLARLRELPSFHAHYRGLARGDRVWRTSDSLACGGVVYLIHDNRQQIAVDIEQIRTWEKRGQLYAVTSTEPQVRTRARAGGRS